MSYDGPYCSERMGPNFMAGSTARELEEFYGDDYDPEFVMDVESLIAEEALVRENRMLRQQIADLQAELEDRDA